MKLRIEFLKERHNDWAYKGQIVAYAGKKPIYSVGLWRNHDCLGQVFYSYQTDQMNGRGYATLEEAIRKATGVVKRMANRIRNERV